MPRSLLPSYLACGLLILLTLASPAGAQTAGADVALREQVRTLVRQAGESMDRGDRVTAIALLEQARRLRPDPTLDYNLGIAHGELGQGPQAAQAFERFLAAADPVRVLPDRLADAQKRLAGYQASLARLRTRITLPPGHAETDAQLSVDDQPAPQGSLWLQPGMHRLRVSAPGLSDYRVAVDLAAGESREVTGELYAERLGAGDGLLRDPPPKKTEPRPFYKTWWFWTAVGVGTAATVGLIAAGASGAFNHIAPGTDIDTVDLSK